MWPMLLDYSKDECKRIMRRLELEAYASIISVFRAHGDLSKEKKSLLQDLQQTLSISTERHRAEVRRAINDEKLATIAENIAGTMSTSEWLIEGRRLVPLMPRLVPQTALTATANQAASAMMEKNATLPPPSQTWNKDGHIPSFPKPTRSSSPSSNVVVLPSGTSIHIKGMLNQEEDDELSAPAKRSGIRSLSTDSQNAASVSTQTPRITYTTASSTLPGASPVKITISKSPQGRPVSAQASSQPPKVFLVTSAGSAAGSAVMQRSISVPVVKTPPTTLTTYAGGTGPSRSSVLIPGVSSTAGHPMGPSFPGVITSTTNTSLVSTSVTMPTSVMSPSPAMFSPSVQIGLGKVRPRIVPRQRYPAMAPQQKPGVVIPMGPQLVSPSHHSSAAGPHVSQAQVSAGVQVTPTQQHTTGGFQVKTLSKPTIQIKQEGGMKIITQSGTSKILPKPSQISGGGGGTPVVMVNTGQSTSGTTMLPRSISTYTAHSGGKVLNITTPGGRVIATTTKATNVVTVNPKTLHLTAVKSGSGSTTVSKPNVIVVQKTQHPRFQNPMGQGPPNIRTLTTSTLPGTIDKELMGLVHKDSQGRHVLTGSASQSISTAGSGRGCERRVIITTSGSSGEVKQPVSIIHRGRTDSEGKSSLLADLIQAAGIMPSDASAETTVQDTEPYEFDNPESTVQSSLSSSSSTLSSSSLPLTLSSATTSIATSTLSGTFLRQSQPRLIQQSQLLQSHSEPDPPSDPPDEEVEAETGGYTVQLEARRPSQDNDSRDKIFTLEQAMSIWNKEYVDLTETGAGGLTVTSTSVATSSTTTSILPSILTSTSAGLPGTQPQGQPKVSILSATPKLVRELSRDMTLPQPAEGSKLKGESVVPEEGLKEGQLDTQTGLFYQVGSFEDFNKSTRTVSPLLQTRPVPAPPTAAPAPVPSSSSSSSSLTLTQPPLDLLSSSLAEAQIDLDPFSEENSDSGTSLSESQTTSGIGLVVGESSVSSRPGMAEVLREETAKDGTRILTVSNPASSQQESGTTHGSQLVSLPSQLTRSSTIPTTLPSPSPLSSPAPSASSLLHPVQDLSKPTPKAAANIGILSHVPITTATNLKPSVLPIAVSVEPSPTVITFKLDELTSQRIAMEDQVATVISEPEVSSAGFPLADGESLDSLASLSDPGLTTQHDEFTPTLMSSSAGIDSHSSDSQVSSELSSMVRSSKRRRKNLPGMDDLTQSTPGSWIRTASSLLTKICRFRGSPRDRTEIPAAEWFTFPVDSQDAPDYYTVIQTPMDLSTMRKKLEAGQYSSFEDFQTDMELIRTNCFLYNSEGTKVRRDCEEVMTFYRSEVAKLQEKQVASKGSPAKKSKMEEKGEQKH